MFQINNYLTKKISCKYKPQIEQKQNLIARRRQLKGKFKIGGQRHNRVKAKQNEQMIW